MTLRFKKTGLSGVYEIQPIIQQDNRGSFFRTYCRKEFSKHDITFIPVQTSTSFSSKKGTIRGLHYQKSPHAEDKMVRCVRGKIFDVIIDLRKHSATYKKWVAIELSEKNYRAIYIPQGCAHGFQTLTDQCTVEYQMSEYYVSPLSTGIRWNDSTLGIPWPIKNAILSQKDKNLPFIDQITYNTVSV